MTLILMPALAGVGGFFATVGMVGVMVSFVAVATVWSAYIKRKADRGDLPQKLSQILLPIFISFTYYMLVWVLHFAASGLNYRNLAASLFLFTPFHFLTTLLLAIIGDRWHFLPMMYTAMFIAMLIPTLMKCWTRFVLDKRIWVYAVCVACLLGIAIYQHHAQGLHNHAHKPFR